MLWAPLSGALFALRCARFGRFLVAFGGPQRHVTVFVLVRAEQLLGVGDLVEHIAVFLRVNVDLFGVLTEFVIVAYYGFSHHHECMA